MSHSKPMTAAPTPRDGERAEMDASVALAEKLMNVGGNDPVSVMFKQAELIQESFAQRVAEAVGPLEKELSTATSVWRTEADRVSFLEKERDSLAALVVRLNGLLKESYDEIINLMVKVDAKEPQGWEGTRRRTLLRLHIEQALKAVPGDLADSVILRKSDDLYAVNKTLNARNEEVEGLIDEADLRNAALEAENRALRALVEEACEVIEEAGDGWTAESYIATAKDIRTKATLAPKEGNAQ